MSPVRVIIAGSRHYPNNPEMEKKVRAWLLCLFLNELLGEVDPVIVCGMARGMDTFGEKFADDYGYKVEYYAADWDTYGKKAGYIRNEEMAQNADVLVLVWDGKSPGSKNMKKLAGQYDLKVIELVL